MTSSGAARDDGLVELALLGDKDAFSALIRRHQAPAERLCRRMLGTGETSRDAVQEATLAAWLNLDRLRRRDRFGPWLCGIALNIARQTLRAALADARMTARLR